MGRHRKPEPWAPIIVGCRSTLAARRVAASLREDAGLSGVETDGRNVRVPWDGSPDFLAALFEGAVKLNAVDAKTVESAMRTRMAEIERRKAET